MSDTQKDIDIVTAIPTFWHKLRLNVVTEGVENQGQMRTLIEVGCNLF
ncbi:MAG: EAL domain-containing protein [Dechloromonas sp.]|nr:EAL domain-containing protein [Dechloromonas sp.]